jgi:hypothetical protein
VGCIEHRWYDIIYMERKFILLFFQISGKINGYIDSKYRRNKFATKKTKNKKITGKIGKTKTYIQRF